MKKYCKKDGPPYFLLSGLDLLGEFKDGEDGEPAGVREEGGRSYARSFSFAFHGLAEGPYMSLAFSFSCFLPCSSSSA